MKFTCERDTLVKEISIAQEVISSRNALSVLSNVLLIADQEGLLIRATDLKVSFENKIPVDVREPGGTTVFCDKLLGILRSLPSGEIVFEEKNDTMHIAPQAKKISFKLKSISAEKYPEIQLVPDDDYFEFPQKDFLEMISQTVFSVSDDETRFFMNGVYLEPENGSLIMVATDGRRLAFVRKDLPSSDISFEGVIIPPKILYMIKKLASGEGPLSIAFTEKAVFIKFDNQKISSSLIEGQFPNYRRVIPEEQEQSLKIKKEDLAEALKRVSLLVEQKSRRIYMDLMENGMVLRSEEGEIGIAREELGCEYSGPEMTIALNYIYLVEPIKVMEEETIQIKFSEPNKAIGIYSVPEQDYFHIVMPMQVD